MIALDLKHLTLRLAMLTVSVILSAFFIATTPTSAERRLLSNAADSAVSVVELRMARAALAFAPKATVRFIVWRSDGSVKPSEVRQMLVAIAEGKKPEDIVHDPTRRSFSLDGPKFLRPLP